MLYEKIMMDKKKRIALIAHDNKKIELLDWVKKNKDLLRNHDLYGTGTTGGMVSRETGLLVTTFKSGPLGGDQQIGSRIVEGEIDFLIFFWDPLASQPHDPDVKALLRIAIVLNIPVASNTATADFLLKSEFMNEEYERSVVDYAAQL